MPLVSLWKYFIAIRLWCGDWSGVWVVVVNIPPPSQYLNIPCSLPCVTYSQISDLSSLTPILAISSRLTELWGDIMELYEFSQNHPRSSRVTAVEFDGEGQWERIYFRSTEKCPVTVWRYKYKVWLTSECNFITVLLTRFSVKYPGVFMTGLERKAWQFEQDIWPFNF